MAQCQVADRKAERCGEDEPDCSQTRYRGGRGGGASNRKVIAEQKYLLGVFPSQLSEFSGRKTIGVDHANESPVVGQLAFTLPVVDVVCVVATDIHAIQQEGDLATVGCVDSPTEGEKGQAGF